MLINSTGMPPSLTGQLHSQLTVAVVTIGAGMELAGVAFPHSMLFQIFAALVFVGGIWYSMFGIKSPLPP